MSIESRSSRLLTVLESYERIIIVTHNTPDPDGIASGWALVTLIKSKLGKVASFVSAGPVLRAENVRMLDLLRPPLSFVDEINPTQDSAVVLVDCVPNGDNSLLSGANIAPVAVIDHHSIGGERFRVPFRDIRPKVSASASIVASYLLEQEIDPPIDLATALLYALRTDTQTANPKLSRLDRQIVAWLGGIADYEKLTEIENAPLSSDYYADLVLALQKTFLYGQTALCFLPSASAQEIVGEVADLIIRCASVDQVFCAAQVGEEIMISARSTKEGGDIVVPLRITLEELGSCGGHIHRAGGKIVLSGEAARFDQELQDKLKKRWLAACGAPDKRGVRLVAKKEVLDNL